MLVFNGHLRTKYFNFVVTVLKKWQGTQSHDVLIVTLLCIMLKDAQYS